MNDEEFLVEFSEDANTQQEIDKIAASIAPVYASAAAYDIGALVMRNKELYKCIAAVQAGEVWDPAKWEPVKVSGELTDNTEVINEISGHVDELAGDVNTISGELGSIRDLTTADKSSAVKAINEVNSHADTNTGNIAALDSGKVDKVTGKGLSENDFTNADKSKLNGIAAGAEVNVQADWAQGNTGADDYIKNKPTIPTYTGTAPIGVSGTDITHDNSGATAGAYGDTSNKQPGFGSTFKVPSFTVDAKGHLTAASEHTVKIPEATATTAKPGLMSAGDKVQIATNRNDIAAINGSIVDVFDMIAGEETNGEPASQGYDTGDYIIIKDSNGHAGLYKVATAIPAEGIVNASVQLPVIIGEELHFLTSYVDSIITGTIEENIGDSAVYDHANGEPFMAYDGDEPIYCMAVQDISQGETLTLNTNCIAQTIPEVINVLWAMVMFFNEEILDNPGIMELLWNTPQEDGTYAFKCIVDGGEPTYYWEAE